MFERSCSSRYSGWFAWRRRKTPAPRADSGRLSRHQSIANNNGRVRVCSGSPNRSRYRFRQDGSRLRSRRFYRYNWLSEPGLVADAALNYVGRLEVVPLDELRSPRTKPKEIIACPAAFRGLLLKRKYDAYKNQFGRVGVVAGSKGFVGAALMASQGALRAGDRK